MQNKTLPIGIVKLIMGLTFMSVGIAFLGFDSFSRIISFISFFILIIRLNRCGTYSTKYASFFLFFITLFSVFFLLLSPIIRTEFAYFVFFLYLTREIFRPLYIKLFKEVSYSEFLTIICNEFHNQLNLLIEIHDDQRSRKLFCAIPVDTHEKFYYLDLQYYLRDDDRPFHNDSVKYFLLEKNIKEVDFRKMIKKLIGYYPIPEDRGLF
jgi:hypothetical protein